jgi:glutamine---fructose-6-phosphate transaminase (isomerizing)
MCGIVGILGETPDAAAKVVEGLKRLEYRGYDSAGVACVMGGTLQRVRAKGKIISLEEALSHSPLAATTAIGHTRWATHGMPSETNAHPHATKEVAVVHNGIIENYRELKKELQEAGFTFESETDTETIPVLLTYYLNQGFSPKDAVSETTKRLHGAYALGIIFTCEPNVLYAVRHGAPLAVGKRDGTVVLGSDASAVAHVATTLAYLEDGDWARLSLAGITIYNGKDEVVERTYHAISGSLAAGKEGYRHFMQKEIFEQPAVVAETFGVYYNAALGQATFPMLSHDFTNVSRLQFVACGTSYYAACVAAYWFESIARIPVSVDIASEFRYREPPLDANGLSIVISQSGETADTLAAMRYIKKHQPCFALVNVPHSTIAREADGVMMTYAGPEIGVASTKAFTTQLTVLACLALAVAKARNTLSDAEFKTHTTALLELPSLISAALLEDAHIERVAHHVFEARDVLYLGRGTSMAVAYEGALKLKELSYIHAEAYAAGEMKHGPIALIDEHVPIVAIAPKDGLFEKTASNLQEAAARGGKIILLSDEDGISELEDMTIATITMPICHPFVAPILYSIPVQLLAYHAAVLKGTDVDQPRNLAKSVTVE